MLFGASSSLVQQHGAKLQMKWNQAHHWVGPALLLQLGLNEVLAHPETRTKELNLTQTLFVSNFEPIHDSITWYQQYQPDTNIMNKTRDFVWNYNGSNKIHKLYQLGLIT